MTDEGPAPDDADTEPGSTPAEPGSTPAKQGSWDDFPDDEIRYFRNVDPRFSEGSASGLPADVYPALRGTEIHVKRAKTYQKDEHDAVTRRWLAFVVLGVVSVLYGAGVVGLLTDVVTSAELGRIALVLGPIQALAAAVLGFYFGQDKS